MKKKEIASFIKDYIEEEGPATAETIKDAIIANNKEKEVKRTTYYYALKYLLEWEIIEPYKRNEKIRLASHSGKIPDDLKNTDVDNWIILFILEKEGHPLTVKQIEEKCFSEEKISVQNRLNSLVKEGLVIKTVNNELLENFGYSVQDVGSSINVPTDKKPVKCTYSLVPNFQLLLITNSNKMKEYAYIYQMLGTESVYYESFAEKLKAITGLSSDLPASTTGKSNVFRNESIICLENLLDSDYKKYNIEITIENGKKQLAIGSILYSEDANEFYILGQRGSRPPEIIPLSSIKSIKETSVKNDIYENDFYIEYVNQMFEVEAGEVFDVVVHFRPTPDIKRKLYNLGHNRVNAKISYDEQKGIIVYTDRIRGRSKFKRFLRSFGSDAIVISPEELRNEMIESARLTSNLYS